MKIIKYTLASLALITACTVATANPVAANAEAAKSEASATPKDKGHKEFCKHHKNSHKDFKTMAKKLALTDDQKQKISSLKEHKMKVMKSIRTEMMSLQKTFFQLDPQASNYKAKVFEIAGKKANLMRHMIIEKGEMRYLITSLLTPAQLVLRKELLAETTKESEKETKALPPITQ
ncbi:MAG: hypothetical protein KAH22_02605 [Thiotrichaceae bacterium]|nr:hypothetical protein [Thiotrichaceae bacterium]